MTSDCTHVAPAAGPSPWLARARAYAALGELLRTGPTGELMAWLGALGLFEGRRDARGRLEEAQADFTRVFTLEVFPHASVFLDPSGQVGGPHAEAAFRAYAGSGWLRALGPEGATAVSGAADHAGEELRFLAWLCRDVCLGATVRDAARHRHAAWLTGHLLTWWPPFAVAVGQEGCGWARDAVELVWELASDHLQALGASAEVPSLPSFDAGALLTAPGTGIGHLAEALTTPAHTGWFLSRGQLAALAEELELPSGFGTRRQTLANLFRSAARFDRLEALVDALLRLVDAWHQAYDRLARRAPAAAPFAEAWKAQLDGAARLVTGVHEGMANAEAP